MQQRPQEKGSRLRVPGAMLLAASLLLTSPAFSATRCGTEQDQAVFEVEALKTELMVVATTCRLEERYNAFVQRYQPQLAANGRAFGQFFVRTKGRTGQRATDAYITNLANARSTEAQALGSDFCPRNTGLFNEVMALPSAAELPAYAAGKDLFPASLAACDGISAAPAAAPARSAARSTTRARAR
jgi:hypothetical protein